MEKQNHRSIRTEYRRKRIKIIKDCILLLIEMLLLPLSKLEKIPLVFFKKIKIKLQYELYKENNK